MAQPKIDGPASSSLRQSAGSVVIAQSSPASCHVGAPGQSADCSVHIAIRLFSHILGCIPNNRLMSTAMP